MEVNELKYLFIIQPEDNLKEGCELKCPKCNKWSSHKNWEKINIYCYICYQHPAMICPHCEEDFDHTTNITFECRANNTEDITN